MRLRELLVIGLVNAQSSGSGSRPGSTSPGSGSTGNNPPQTFPVSTVIQPSPRPSASVESRPSPTLAPPIPVPVTSAVAQTVVPSPTRPAVSPIVTANPSPPPTVFTTQVVSYSDNGVGTTITLTYQITATLSPTGVLDNTGSTSSATSISLGLVTAIVILALLCSCGFAIYIFRRLKLQKSDSFKDRLNRNGYDYNDKFIPQGVANSRFAGSDLEPPVIVIARPNSSQNLHAFGQKSPQYSRVNSNQNLPSLSQNYNGSEKNVIVNQKIDQNQLSFERNAGRTDSNEQSTVVAMNNGVQVNDSSFIPTNHDAYDYAPVSNNHQQPQQQWYSNEYMDSHSSYQYPAMGTYEPIPETTSNVVNDGQVCYELPNDKGFYTYVDENGRTCVAYDPSYDKSLQAQQEQGFYPTYLSGGSDEVKRYDTLPTLKNPPTSSYRTQ
ncbi:hypothetical protein BC833DRAFT_152362 [Globomyces pollinis-pini]|nr:hypothetical protein BC833DRAFT_152362 [Globomyces pollinis-pini]KAJ2995781.1 hypothetical protein HDV02_000468 [Globomyces sp. JEL0801]